jgi:hypothetical protein
MYQGTVRHHYDGLDPAAFCRIRVRVKEADMTGWLTSPGDEGCAKRIATQLADEPAAGPPSGVSIQAGGSVRVTGASVAGRDIHAGGRPAPAAPSPRLGRIFRGRKR